MPERKVPQTPKRRIGGLVMSAIKRDRGVKDYGEPCTGTCATFTAHDGETLQSKIWAPATGFKRALLLLHRGHEHAGR